MIRKNSYKNERQEEADDEGILKTSRENLSERILIESDMGQELGKK